MSRSGLLTAFDRGPVGLSLGIALLAALWVTLAGALDWPGAVAVILGPVVLVAVVASPELGLLILLTTLPFSVMTAFRVANYLLPALILASWFLGLVYTRRWPVLSPRLHGWFAVLVFWIVIASAFSPFPDRGLVLAARYTLLFLMTLAMVNLWSPSSASKVLMGLAVLIVIPAGFGLWQFAEMGLEQFLFSRAFAPERISSIYDNPNSFGLLMGHGLIITASLLLVPSRGSLHLRKLVVRSLLVLMILVLGGGLLVSLSRSSYLYAMAGIITLAFCRPGLRWPIGLGVLLVLALLLFSPFSTLLSPILRLEAGTSFREDLWRAGWDMLRDHPWTGVGPGNNIFEGLRGEYMSSGVFRALLTAPAGGAHNAYLNMGAQLGWMGLLLVVALFVMLFSKLSGAARRFQEGSWIAGAAAAGVVAHAVHAFFETDSTIGMGRVSNCAVFLVFVVILFQLERWDSRTGFKDKNPGLGST